MTIDLRERAEDPAATAASPPPSEPAVADTVLTRQVRYFVAMCSIAAGILHLLAMVAHADHHPTLGRAFLAMGVVQIGWGVWLFLERRTLVVLAGAVVTAAAIVWWIFSRTTGISWFPGLEGTEPLEWRDVVTQFFQFLAVAGAVLLLLPASVHRPAGKRVELLPIAVMAALTIGALGILYAATHDYVHLEDGVGHEH